MFRRIEIWKAYTCSKSVYTAAPYPQGCDTSAKLWNRCRLVLLAWSIQVVMLCSCHESHNYYSLTQWSLDKLCPHGMPRGPQRALGKVQRKCLGLHYEHGVSPLPQRTGPLANQKAFMFLSVSDSLTFHLFHKVNVFPDYKTWIYKTKIKLFPFPERNTKSNLSQRQSLPS